MGARDVLATRAIAAIWKLGQRVDRERDRRMPARCGPPQGVLATAAVLAVILVIVRRRGRRPAQSGQSEP